MGKRKQDVHFNASTQTNIRYHLCCSLCFPKIVQVAAARYIGLPSENQTYMFLPRIVQTERKLRFYLLGFLLHLLLKFILLLAILLLRWFHLFIIWIDENKTYKYVASWMMYSFYSWRPVKSKNVLHLSAHEKYSKYLAQFNMFGQTRRNFPIGETIGTFFEVMNTHVQNFPKMGLEASIRFKSIGAI